MYKLLKGLTGDKKQDAHDSLKVWKLIADPSHTFSMLTPEDINQIRELIREEIQLSKKTRPSNPEPKDYHTVYDIRDLITARLSEFQQWIGKDSFQLPLLRHFLALHVDYKPGDLEIMPNGKDHSRIIRFDQQVANAVQTWKHGPFVKTETPGKYLFR